MEEIKEFCELGIVRRGVGPWTTLIVTRRKPDESVRICCDYRWMNAVTVPDPYHMPTVEEILERWGKSKAISKLDLSQGYYQIKIAPDSIRNTAIICPFGKFEFLRIQFGVMNGPAIFH